MKTDNVFNLLGIRDVLSKITPDAKCNVDLQAGLHVDFNPEMKRPGQAIIAEDVSNLSIMEYQHSKYLLILWLPLSACAMPSGHYH